MAVLPRAGACEGEVCAGQRHDRLGAFEQAWADGASAKDEARVKRAAEVMDAFEPSAVGARPEDKERMRRALPGAGSGLAAAVAGLLVGGLALTVNSDGVEVRVWWPLQ